MTKPLIVIWTLAATVFLGILIRAVSVDLNPSGAARPTAPLAKAAALSAPNQMPENRPDRIGNISGIVASADGKSAMVLQDQVGPGPIAPGNPAQIRRMEIEFGEMSGSYGRAYPEGTSCFVLSPDGERALRGRYDGLIMLQNISSGTKKEYKGHKGRIQAVAWSQDGRTFLSAGEDGVLKLWDRDSAEVLKTLSPCPPVRHLALSPDGKWALSALDDSAPRFVAGSAAIQVWDLASGKIAHGLRVYASNMQFSPNGKLALFASSDATVQLWKVPSWKLYARIGNADNFNVTTAAAFTPDGNYVFTGTNSGLRLWEVHSGKLANTFDGNPIGIQYIAPLPDCRRVLTAGGNKIVLWDFRTGEEIMTLLGGKIEGPKIVYIAFLPNGKQLIARSKNEVTLWDLTSGKPIRTLGDFRFGTNAVSADSKKLLASYPMGLWDLTTGKSIWKKQDECWPVALSRDGRWAIAARRTPERSLDFWDAEKGKIIRQFPGTDHLGFDGLAISADGKFALSKTSDQKLRVWDLSGGKLLTVVDDLVGVDEAPYPHEVSFSPDGKLAFSRHRVSRVWELQTGKLLESSEMLPPGKIPIAYSPDGKRCLCRASNTNRSIELWDVQTGKLLRTLTPFHRKGPLRSIQTVIFSPDCHWIAMAGEGQLLQLWDAEKAELIYDLVSPPR